jgi:signal transduction histidine kinase
MLLALANNWSAVTGLLLVAQALALAGFWWWSRRFTAPGLAAFHIVVLAMAGRTASEAVEWAFAAPTPAVLFWTLGVKCTLSSLLAAGLLLLFADVSGLNRWATPRRRRWLIGITLLLGALAFTNPWTGWISPDTATGAGWSFGRYRSGPGMLYLLLANASALLFALGATLYVWRGASPLLRKQLALLLIGYSLPTLTVFIYRTNLLPTDWPNLTPLTRIGAIALFSWALNRGQLWRLGPIARSFVLEHHDHGLIVADRDRHVVDSNPSARRLLGLPIDATPYGPIAALLARWPELPTLARHDDHTAREHRPDPTCDTFWLLDWTPLRAPGDTVPRGFLLSIADITERKRTETRLREALDARTHEWQRATAAALRAAEEEQNRLGHLLHDTLCQELVGCTRLAALLREQIAQGTPPSAERLGALEHALAEASQRAREVSHLLAGSGPTDLPLAETLDALARHLEASLGIECELTVDPAFPATTPEQTALLVRIVREAVCNAARHGHARRAWIDLLADDHHATLTIGNDGTPPPPPDLRTEGLGLRQMRMRAALLGGHFTLSTGPGGGACLELTFPPILPSIPQA